MGTTTVDPFSAAHQALWDALTGYQPWANLIRGNKVQVNQGIQFPPKFEAEDFQAGDAPEVTILQGPYQTDPFQVNSLACSLVQSYPMILIAADHNILPVNDVKFQTLRAILTAGPHLGLPRLIRNVSMTKGQDDPFPAQKREQKGAARWVSVCTFMVYMIVNKADVLSGVIPTTP